ncbi:uncharacterized protein METZ01_LOCUS202399, partial [marine metagenome]
DCPVKGGQDHQDPWLNGRGHRAGRRRGARRSRRSDEPIQSRGLQKTACTGAGQTCTQTTAGSI